MTNRIKCYLEVSKCREASSEWWIPQNCSRLGSGFLLIYSGGCWCWFWGEFRILTSLWLSCLLLVRAHRSRSLQMHSQSQYCLLWKRLKGSSHSSWLHLLSSQVHLLKGQGQLHLCWSPGLGSLHKVSAKFIVFPGWCSVLNSYPWISWNILCRHGGVFSAVISTGLWLVNYHLSWRGAWKGNCKTGNARDHSY